MIVIQAMDFVKEYINAINEGLKANEPGHQLSKTQACWLGFCITAILMTNAISWAAFKRISLGSYSEAALSWMFCRSNILWSKLLKYSVLAILNRYGITEGVLVLDETDNARSKNTTKIAFVNKIRDKKSGGYLNGQLIIFLFLVTAKVSFPVGFEFYNADPKMREWRKKDTQLKKQGVKKSDRPAAPARDPLYPSVKEIALQLLKNFATEFPQVKIKAILADALYGSADFMDNAAKIFGNVQVISQIKYNQKVKGKNRKLSSAKEYFDNAKALQLQLKIRGGATESLTLVGARLLIKSHGKKRFVIAMKYDGETEYRYIVATDMTWRMEDIVQAYTLRWLIEVFFQDWKGYTGWCAMAKQPGVDGARRSLLLSLLVDHSLILHPEQQALIENKMPTVTVGSLRESIRFEALVNFIRQIIHAENPLQYIDAVSEHLTNIVVLRQSSKHMSGREWGNLAPSPHLIHKAS